MRQSFCARFSALKRCLVDLLAAEVLRFAQDDDACVVQGDDATAHLLLLAWADRSATPAAVYGFDRAEALRFAQNDNAVCRASLMLVFNACARFLV
jgi:hypothetical protein